HWGQNSNIERILRLRQDEDKRYWNGPVNVTTGSDSIDIANSVQKRICERVRHAILRCKPIKVNLFGWSRGGAIAIYVAYRLGNFGCDLGPDVPHQYVNVNVNFLGLFDAVNETTVIPDMDVPGTVAHYEHAVKTAKQTLFPTMRTTKQQPFDRYSGEKT